MNKAPPTRFSLRGAARAPRTSLWTACTVAALAVGLGCDGQDITQVDSPFQMGTDSLPFPNYALGFNASVLDAEGAHRMFGDDVCEPGSDPCQLTLPARAFVAEANLAMNGGRCEGFAVLSVLMSEGLVSPDTFGAPLARSLVLENNPALQREIAYWFSTQLLPGAVGEATTGYNARQVLPVLTEALAEDATERYRIGIVRKEGQVVSGGHALTPLGYYQDENDPQVYWVRVYDNNQPDFEKLLKIDLLANRWEFEANTDPTQPSRLYFGDSSNDNPLWLAPIIARTGTHPCHFCGDESASVVDGSGGAQISVELPNGDLAGLTEEGFVDADGVTVTPSFSTGLDAEPLAMRIAVSAEVGDDLVTRIRAVDDPANPGARQRVRQVHKNVTATVEQLNVRGEDRLTTHATGVAYENNSRTPIALQTQVVSGGRTLSVSVAMDEGSDMIETQVDPATGAVAVEVAGADGASVTVQLEAEADDGEVMSQDFTFSAGGASSFAADTAAWTAGGGNVAASVSNDGEAPRPLVGGCFDGIRNGDETDVDCGGSCARGCGVTQACDAGDDCEGGFCASADGRCVETSCDDGTLSGNETDVDCGGDVCDGCGNGAACAVAGDCAAGALCANGTCTPSFVVGVSVTGLSLVDSMVLQNNGGDDLTITANGSFVFATRVLDTYAVTLLQAPENSSCTIVDGSGTANTDVTVAVTCTDGFTVGGTLFDLPVGESVTLSSSGSLLTLTSNGAFAFFDPTLGAYAVQVVTQPASATCSTYNATGTASADVTDVEVRCCAAGFTGEACDACLPGHGTPPTCTAPICGDGVLDPGEACDDANSVDGDGCSAACVIEPGQSCENAVQVNTGSDNNGGRASVGSADLVWSWSETREGARTPAIVAGNCAPGQWVDPGGYADWVNRYGCDTPAPFSNTTWYHATFTIPTEEAAAATSVSGTVWADNRIEDVFVNGVSTGVQSPNTAGFQGDGVSFGAWPSSLYREGVNTISVAVENLGTTPNPDGLLVQVPNAFGAGSVCTE